SNSAWRRRGGRFPRNRSVIAGLWFFRQAERERLERCTDRQSLERIDAATWLHAICCTRRGLGLTCHDSAGAAAAGGARRHSSQYASCFSRPGAYQRAIGGRAEGGGCVQTFSNGRVRLFS